MIGWLPACLCFAYEEIFYMHDLGKGLENMVKIFYYSRIMVFRFVHFRE